MYRITVDAHWLFVVLYNGLHMINIIDSIPNTKSTIINQMI